MTCKHVTLADGSTAILNVGNPDRLIVDARGKGWRFEDTEWGGPQIVGKNGDPATAQPGRFSAFWPAYNAWAKQGRRPGPDNYCLWEPEPPEPEPLHVTGKIYVEAGSVESMMATLAAKGITAKPHPIGGCEQCTPKTSGRKP